MSMVKTRRNREAKRAGRSAVAAWRTSKQLERGLGIAHKPHVPRDRCIGCGTAAGPTRWLCADCYGSGRAHALSDTDR